MIDNFDILRPLIQFDNPGDCYFVQLLKRHKDNPEMSRNMVNVDNFFIYSLEEYDSMKQHIIDSANAHNARAYIRVNRRNTETLALRTLVQVSNLVLSKDFKSVKNAYLKAAGQYSSEPIKRWVVDIDRDVPPHKWNDKVDLIISTIDELHVECNRNSNQGEYKRLLEVPTRNGVHIITNPFNLQKFRKVITEAIDIHKDNPTLLVMPTR